MMFETPPLVVSRPIAACSRCKTAKTRCDGKLPACSACERSGKGAECSSRTESEFARGRERSYVATLEARIARLKQKLAEAGRQDLANASAPLPPPAPTSPAASSVDAHGSPSSVTQAPLSPNFLHQQQQQQQQQHPKVPHKKESEDIEGLVSNFGVLSINAAARDFQGFTETMSYARLIMAAAGKQAIPPSAAAPLPPRHEAVGIAQHYLGGIFSFVPIFEEATFWRALDQCYMPNATPRHMDAWVVRMVLAISLISQSEHFQDAYYKAAVSHVANALELAEIVLRPGSIPSIQAMLLLVEYSRYDPVHFDDWVLVGAVARAIVDLGLHQDPPRGSNMSRTKLRVRQKLFHCVYCLDRSTSISYDRAFSFSDHGTNVAFPGHSSSSSSSAAAAAAAAAALSISTGSANKRNPGLTSPEIRLWTQGNNGLFAAFQLRKIQSEAYQEAYQSSREPRQDPYSFIWSKWHEVQEWLSKYPPGLTPQSKVLAELERLCAHVYMLAPSPRVPDITELAQSLIFEYSIDYVDTLRGALNDPNCRPWLTQLEAIRALKLGRIFLDNLASYQERILQGSLPSIRASLLPHSLTPPPFPYPVHHDNVERAFGFIASMTQILDEYAARFGVTTLADRFRLEQEPVLRDLATHAYAMPPVYHSPAYQTIES